MPAASLHKIVWLERITENKIDELKIKGQLNYIKESATRHKTHNLSASLSSVVLEPEIIPTNTGESRYRYSAKLKVNKQRVHNPTAAEKQLENAIKNVSLAANNKNWKILEQEDDKTDVLTEKVEIAKPFVLPPLDDDCCR